MSVPPDPQPAPRPTLRTDGDLGDLDNLQSIISTLREDIAAGATRLDTAEGLVISSEGAPEDAVQATLSRNPAGDDNALTFTAVAYGADGNAITIEYVDPADADIPLSVAVVGSAIVVTLETDEADAIISTAADVLATVAIDAADSGSGDDGSGVVTALAEAPMTGGEGTGIGIALPGALCIDTDNANVYRNDGTQAVPVWVQLADV